MTPDWKISLGEHKRLPREGTGSFSRYVKIEDDAWTVEVEVVLSTAALLAGTGGGGLFVRTLTVRRPSGEPVTGRDLRRMPATRYVDAAIAAVRLETGERAQAGRDRLGGFAPTDWPQRKAELERKVSPRETVQRGRGTAFWRELNREYETIEKEGGSPTKQLARKYRVKPQTIRVWRHRYGPRRTR